MFIAVIASFIIYFIHIHDAVFSLYSHLLRSKYFYRRFPITSWAAHSRGPLVIGLYRVQQNAKFYAA